MHPTNDLKGIFQEHGHDVLNMAETLADLDVPNEDVELLCRLPWRFPANRIAVERERLGLSAVQPLIKFEFKLPPPPPAWLTPALIVKLFDLALTCPDAGPGEENGDNSSVDESFVLPA